MKITTPKGILEGDSIEAILKKYGTACLLGADLRYADLRGANLFRADLFCADLRGANLYGACLRGANLFRADLSGANLFRADLSGAVRASLPDGWSLTDAGVAYRSDVTK